MFDILGIYKCIFHRLVKIITLYHYTHLQCIAILAKLTNISSRAFIR